jgi:hypothetical protein
MACSLWEVDLKKISILSQQWCTMTADVVQSVNQSYWCMTRISGLKTSGQSKISDEEFSCLK